MEKQIFNIDGIMICGNMSFYTYFTVKWSLWGRPLDFKEVKKMEVL